MSNQCYVCARHVVKSEDGEKTHALVFRITCPRCGVYDISYKYISGERAQPSLTDAERKALSHAIRRATDAEQRFTADLLTYETIRPLLERYPLPEPADHADLLVDCIARRCAYGEATPAENADAWAARVGLKGPSQLYSLQQELDKKVGQSGLGPNGDGNVEFTLTLEGWKRARELRQQRGPGNQAFVAMWFHSEMDAAFDDGFFPALEITGYKAYRVDRDAHNDKIDDKIIAEIRRSKLVVVDATGARPNAYFEAGFAMGLGIPVLWTCNESWEAHLHAHVPQGASTSAPEVTTWSKALAFDTRQHAFTFWRDPAELKEKLTNRICALGLDTNTTSSAATRAP
jgi:hypothetical protein